MLHSPSALDVSSANMLLTWPGYLAKLLMSHKNPKGNKGFCISGDRLLVLSVMSPHQTEDAMAVLTFP